MEVNDQAVRRARRLIEARQYVLDSAWGDENPSAAEENAYLDAHGWDAYGEWHLAVDPEAGEQTKARHRFPYGDFRRVHRSGLTAARQRAAQNDHAAVEAAAAELLDLLDATRAR